MKVFWREALVPILVVVTIAASLVVNLRRSAADRQHSDVVACGTVHQALTDQGKLLRGYLPQTADTVKFEDSLQASVEKTFRECLDMVTSGR